MNEATGTALRLGAVRQVGVLSVAAVERLRWRLDDFGPFAHATVDWEPVAVAVTDDTGTRYLPLTDTPFDPANLTADFLWKKEER